MKNKVLLGFISIVIVLVAFGKGQTKSGPALDEMLQRTMNDSLKNSGAVGVSAAVLLPDGRLWKGASGISREGVPLTPEMLFNIASVHKNFQAALALKLVEEGLLALDDPLEKWLPPYPNINGKITVRQLLNLTSGIDDFVHDSTSPWIVGFQNIEFEKKWTWEEIYSRFIGPPNFQPGQDSAYSTTNFIVLRMIIEKACRSRQIVEFQNRLLRPNHLNHTLANFLDPVPQGIQFAHGWCDFDGDGKPNDVSGHSLNWIATLAPMLVYSTPEDMVKWANALFHKKTVLNDTLLKAMLSFIGPVRNEPLMKGYGLGVMDINLGVMIPKWGAVRCYGHLGSEIGYMTFVGYFPDYGVSMSIMSNRGGDGDAERAIVTVSGAVCDALFKYLGVPESPAK